MPIQISSYHGDTTQTTLQHFNGRRLTVKHDIAIMKKAFALYDAGSVVQVAFNFLTPSEREFMLTGMTQEEQDAIFGKEEE